MSFVHVSGATDLVLIILHFSPEHTQSAHYNPHTLTHTVWYTGALSLLRHTPVPRRVMSLSSHLLSRESFWACWQGNPVLHSMDTPTLPICFYTSPLLTLLFLVSSLLNLFCLHFTTHQFLQLVTISVLSVPRSRARPRLPLLARRTEVGAEKMF